MAFEKYTGEIEAPKAEAYAPYTGEIEAPKQQAYAPYTGEVSEQGQEPQGSVTVSGAPNKAPGVIDTIADLVTPSQETIGSAKKGFVNLKSALVQNQIASLMELQAADKEKYGEYYEKAPASELDKITARDKAIVDKMQTIADQGVEKKAIEKEYGVNPLVAKLTTLRQSDTYNNADFMDKLQATGHEIASNAEHIPGWIGNVALESLPTSLAMGATALAARFGGFNPTVASGAVGASSAFMEFGSEYADLRSQGMPHQEAWEKASVKSGVIGLFDAASAGQAGHAASSLMKDLEKGALKAALKDTGKEVSIQALYGMGGEALGSIASNQQVDPLSVIEEGIGEIAGAPVEAVGTFKTKQQELAQANQQPQNNQQPQPSVPLPPQEQQAAPAATPPIISAAGTPIAPVPLDTAEKQAEAKAAAPIQPTSEANPEIEKQVETKAAELGVPLEDARKLVLEEIQHGTEQSTGVVPGTNQPSISMSQNGPELTGNPAAPQPAGLANVVGATGVPGVRTEAVQAAQPSALTPIQIRNQANTKAFDLYGVPKTQNPDGTFTYSTPAPAVQKQVDAYSMGAYDAAQGFDGSKYAEGFKGKAKAAYEAGFKSVAATPITAAPTETITPEPTPAVTIPVATKGKRGGGRKAVEKTPEQIAQAQLTSKQNQKTNKDAIRDVNAAAAVLEQPAPEQGNFPNQAAYLDASMQHRSRRNQAIDTLHEISKGPQRDNAGGRKAKEALAHPSIMPQEQTALQQRIELRKKQGQAQVSKAKQTTNTERNPKYEGFKTTQQAIKHILENGTAFEKFLARRLQPFLKGVNLVIVRSENDIPNKKIAGEEDKTLKSEFNGANGMYATYKENGQKVRTIFLRSAQFGNMNYQGTNNTVFLHEALHAAINARINEYISMEGKNVPVKLQAAMDALHKTMDNARNEYADRLFLRLPISREVQEIFDITDGFEDLKEFVTYGMTTDAMQQFLLESKGEIIAGQPGAFRSLFRGFVNAIRDLFNMDKNHTSALQDLILVSESLMKYELQGPVQEGVSLARAKKPKQIKIDKDVQKINTSNEAQDVTEGVGNLVTEGHNFEDFKDYLTAHYKGMDQFSVAQIIKTLRTSDLIRWKGDEIPGMKIVDNMTQKMSAMRSSMLAAYAKKADELARFISNKKDNMRILGNAMHLARLKEVTPDAHATAVEAIKNDKRIKELETKIKDPATDAASIPALKAEITKRTNGINIVYDAWEKLGKVEGGQEMYKKVRQFYKDNFTLTRNLLDERIERLKELPGDASDESTPKGQLMAEIRKMQEKDNITEYFPFMRHGAVWLRETGKDIAFHLFDTVAEREQYKLKRARKLGTTVEDLLERQIFSEGNDITSLRNATMGESKLLKNMFEIIDKADFTDKESLKDDLYQTWLMTMPERSIRKQFMHAENVTGFSADIFRNFTESAYRMASQAPKLKYADQISTAVSAARDSLAGNPDQAKLGLFIDAIERRAGEVVNPNTPNAISSAVTRYAYYMLLTGVASAVVQMTAIPVMVMPTLAVDYGVGASAAKLAAYSKLWETLKVDAKMTHDNIPSVNVSLGGSARIRNNPTLRKAFNELRERGIFTFTESNLLSQRGRTPMNSYTGIPKKALRITANIMSGLFSGAERLSREQASMMTFELAYDKTKDFDKAIDAAVAMVQDNMGRYDAMERPELFKYLPVIFQFKMYAMTMSSFFIRHGYNMIAKAISDPKEAAKCGAILTGTLMMGAMFHGLKGMPLYSVVGAIVEALDNPDNDDEEKRKRRAKNPLVYANADLRFRQFLNDYFGEIYIPGAGGPHRLSDVILHGPISELTDMNVGSRTSFDNLWFRNPTPSKTDQGWFQNFLLSNLGPGISTIAGQIGALDEFENGHIERGLEKLLPAFFKNQLAATRLGMEGAKTKAGDMIVKPEDITAANVMAQATGLAPTKVARLQEVGYELKGEYIKAEQDRTKILQRLDDAILNKNFDGSKKDLQPVINQVRQFNNKYPGMDKLLITADTLSNVLDSALDKRAMTYKGVRIPSEDLMPYFIPTLKQAAPVPKK